MFETYEDSIQICSALEAPFVVPRKEKRARREEKRREEKRREGKGTQGEEKRRREERRGETFSPWLAPRAPSGASLSSRCGPLGLPWPSSDVFDGSRIVGGRAQASAPQW